MKNKIKNWLGITDIENTIGKRTESNWSVYEAMNRAWSRMAGLYTGTYETETKPKTVYSDIEKLENRLSEMEKYLKIEYREEKKEFKGYKKKK